MGSSALAWLHIFRKPGKVLVRRTLTLRLREQLVHVRFRTLQASLLTVLHDEVSIRMEGCYLTQEL